MTTPLAKIRAPATANRPERFSQRSWNASSSSLLGSGLGALPGAFTNSAVFQRGASAALVEVEVGQSALDHLGGHPLCNFEAAGADRDVVEADDPREGSAVDHR